MSSSKGTANAYIVCMLKPYLTGLYEYRFFDIIYDEADIGNNLDTTGKNDYS